VFDSGIGGLSVLREIRRQRPDLDLDYVGDTEVFPYGDLAEDDLVARVVWLMDRLLPRFDPSAVVIACNTASTLVLPALRQRFDIPFVGTVPAIKPAALLTRSGLVTVLATPGTVKRDYTRGLIRRFAGHVAVRLVGAPELARIAEAKLSGGRVDEMELRTQIGGCFVDVDGARTDVVVLACTHYPFLIEEMAAVAPWPVEWLDPAPAIARRLFSVLAERGHETTGDLAGAGRGTALFTGRAAIDPALAGFLSDLGLTCAAA